MLKQLKLLGVCFVFLLGLFAGIYTAGASPSWTELPDGTYEPGIIEKMQQFNPIQTATPRASPKDRIPESAIAVWQDRVVLDLQDAQWATFTDTHSMEPVISAGANAIHIVPQDADTIQVGDICSYESDYADGTIIHRIIYKGQDEDGQYFIFKGDNLPASDPGRIRFDQIKRCVVAIIY